ncbi:MAG TPA: hypothetical protein VGC36_08485 [Rhizomicrobium sp.]
MPARKQVAPERSAEAKFLYEQTLTPTDEIGKRMGLSRSAFYLRVKEWGWTRRRYSHGLGDETPGPILPPSSPVVADTPVAATGAGPLADAPPAETASAFEIRARNYARACGAVGRQIEIIEGIQATLLPTQAQQAERSARVLALLNKSLLEITATTAPDEVVEPGDDNDDSLPQDIDEFRRELTRRLRGLVDAERQREGKDAGGTETE